MLRVMGLSRGLVLQSVALLLLGITFPVAAHNGKTAYAIPLSGITIDGKLDDWPKEMAIYPIEWVSPTYWKPTPPDGPADLTASFRVGYDLGANLLYLAIVVQDEDLVIHPEAPSFDNQDLCEVYIDADHSGGDRVYQGAMAAQQYVMVAGRSKYYGAGLPGADSNPGLLYQSNTQASGVRAAVLRLGQVTVYEWAIPLFESFPDKRFQIQTGKTIGFDVVVSDADGMEKGNWVAWTPEDKVHNLNRFGDLALVTDYQGLGIALGKTNPVDYRDAGVIAGQAGPAAPLTGILQGNVRWEDKAEGRAFAKVRIQSLTSPELWVQVETDSQGAYEAELPTGKYRVEAGYRRQKVEAEVEVKGKDVERVRELYFAKTPLGLVTPAGRRKTVQAGMGSQQGAWHTFGVSDGLPSANINDMQQDREGYLWFGTQSGFVRYDGEHFTTFTDEDGLLKNGVPLILEDREGNLWFGTSSGVSRYDGEKFTTFTTEDGLANNYVASMMQDRDGNLWFGTSSGVSRYDGEKFTTLTTSDGLANNYVASMMQDRDGNLWFGTGIFEPGQRLGGVSRYDGEKFTTLTTEDGLADNGISSMMQDRDGNLWFGASNGVSRYDGKKFTTFTRADGLANNAVQSIVEDREGNLWFGTYNGVSRYDGKKFTTFTRADGLANNVVQSIVEDREGNLWFGTYNGVSRYDGQAWATFTTQDGLASPMVYSGIEDRNGYLWFGTAGGGVSRYNGKSFTTFTAGDSLAGKVVMSLLEDREGHLWFGTMGGVVSRYDGQNWTTFTVGHASAYELMNIPIAEDHRGNLWIGAFGWGVTRYDGHTFTAFTTQDGLVSNSVISLMADREGHLWVGTMEGVSWYDGQRFTTFTTKNGLVDNVVESILGDLEGHLWFGTRGGATRYDGEQFTTFTKESGLPGTEVSSMLQDREGNLWFGTNGGIARYDGVVFQSLLNHDGLISDAVTGILQDREGNTWITTQEGISRYRPRYIPPPIYLTDVVADHRYSPVGEIRLPSSQSFIAFEFQGISFKTRPGQIVYVYRLEGYDKEWQQTREKRVEYTDLPMGEYTFQVKAVDRDLTYSGQPATVRVTVHPPYGQITLVGALGLALIGLATASGTAIRRHRAFLREQQARLQAQEQLNKELEKELQTAHEMQMALMPKEPPRIAGFEITGRCMPANHVGGDLFQYFHQHDRLSISLADVTGHAMEAAIPVVMFSGILRSHMGMGATVEELFGKLNQALHGTLTGHTLVCLAMGQLDPSTRRLRFSNAGCPYPYHYRAATGEVVELQMDAYPLGVRPDTTYRGAEIQLEPGDRVVFCSDGIAEAANAAGEMFGFERTADTVRRGCAEDLSAEALLARIIQEVKAFSGEVPQGDDQTVVVVKVEAENKHE